MSSVDLLPNETLSGIARQIGRILDMGGKFFPLDDHVEIRDSFPLWTILPDSLNASLRQGADFPFVATPLYRWHHQLFFGGEPKGYAITLEKELGVHRVLDVMDSSLAAKVDRTIDWIDHHVPETTSVRLLDIEPNYLHAFWLLGGNAPNHLVVVNSPPSLNLAKDILIPGSEFLAQLAGFWGKHRYFGLTCEDLAAEGAILQPERIG